MKMPSFLQFGFLISFSHVKMSLNRCKMNYYVFSAAWSSPCLKRVNKTRPWTLLLLLQKKTLVKSTSSKRVTFYT